MRPIEVLTHKRPKCDSPLKLLYEMTHSLFVCFILVVKTTSWPHKQMDYSSRFKDFKDLKQRIKSLSQGKEQPLGMLLQATIHRRLNHLSGFSA